MLCRRLPQLVGLRLNPQNQLMSLCVEFDSSSFSKLNSLFFLSFYLWFRSLSCTTVWCWVWLLPAPWGINFQWNVSLFPRIVAGGYAEQSFDETCDVSQSLKILSIRQTSWRSGRFNNRSYSLTQQALLVSIRGIALLQSQTCITVFFCLFREPCIDIIAVL